MDFELRDAIASDTADAAGIALIYNDAVAHGTAIWNERLVDAAERQAWIAARHGETYREELVRLHRFQVEQLSAAEH